MHHLYLSPHLDDAIYSCGGLIAQQTAEGDRVTVLTICAGDAPTASQSPIVAELEKRWGELDSPIAVRRQEDAQACTSLGASYVHLEIPDAVYRLGMDGEPLYASEAAIFGEVHESETDLPRSIAQELDRVCADIDRIYCPIGIGGHVDHWLVRKAAESLGRELWYYKDFPYAARDEPFASDLGWPTGRQVTLPLDSATVEAWIEAILRYRSQLSTFWEDAAQLENELRAYLEMGGGLQVFGPR